MSTRSPDRNRYRSNFLTDGTFAKVLTFTACARSFSSTFLTLQVPRLSSLRCHVHYAGGSSSMPSGILLVAGGVNLMPPPSRHYQDPPYKLLAAERFPAALLTSTRHLRQSLLAPTQFPTQSRVLHSPSLPPFMSMLPQEIIDQIIAYLHDDTQSLRACSTVYRTWTQSSQRHIFHHISIDLQPSSSIVPTFSQSLTSTPHIAECLQHLSVSEETSLGRADNPDMLYSIHSLTALFPVLVNLTTLHINFNFSPWEPSHDMENMLLTAVHTPTLAEVTFASISSLLHPRTVLSLFRGTSVKKLFIHDWEGSGTVEGPVPPGIPLPSISFLSLSFNYSMANKWDPKTYIGDFPHLATFRVVVEYWDELVAHCRAIDRRFPSIDTFQCHWEGAHFSLSPRDSGPISVPDITHFRHIHLTINARHAHWVQVHQIVLWWGYVFRNAGNSIIETATLSFPMRFPLASGSEEASWWHTLDSLLADQRLARLHTVHLEAIQYRNSTNVDRLAVKSRVEVAFPELYRLMILKLKILDIVYHGPALLFKASVNNPEMLQVAAVNERGNHSV
ncbi:uncharacterized protein BT62DRAFT_1070995 [Guyanagaster necrorhizus]|uniref:F-box domain-containing protein n=1 Tax=Guyanagaster necrorhizus TaxID=856835 RepID=A0A9P8AXV1_9AGAR|nr:uncharacterized protein BT62DRAFT_1070995 [Guyanagaster necrorhizus MCA 3950]KAG7451775.1 hypothetical protein BT62DRAFT_1070995 [Guyanagaster necrorhizus MCA 3950]